MKASEQRRLFHLALGFDGKIFNGFRVWFLVYVVVVVVVVVVVAVAGV